MTVPVPCKPPLSTLAGCALTIGATPPLTAVTKRASGRRVGLTGKDIGASWLSGCRRLGGSNR